MQTVGLNVILGADFSSAQEAMAKFRQSVDALAAQTSKTFAQMAGTARDIGNAFKPVSDGARNATQTVINESKARQQADREETQAAINASRIRMQGIREEQQAQRAATQAKRAEKDVYGQLVAESNELVRKYYNAAAAIIKYGDASKITAEDLEELRVKALGSQEQLKSIEAGAGRFQRNVGNYSGATQYLQQSIAQLSGEIPNFFQSMRIGFMSIGNNIQPISMAISQLRAENAKLIAQGKETIPVFKTVLKSFLGWQTLLLVGVGVISAYGGKLIDMATGADETKAKAKALKEQQDQLNKAFESGASSASKTIVQVQTLAAEMTNSNTPLSKKKDLYNQLIAQYPQLDDGTGTWTEKIKRLSIAINNDLIPALRKQAVMQGYAAQAAKLGQEIAANSAQSAGLLAKREAARAIIQLSPKPSISAFREAAAAEKAYKDNQDAAKDLDRQLSALINKQVEVSQALDKTVLSQKTYKEQLQNTVKAEQAKLDALKTGTPEYEKQYNVLQKAKNALKEYDPPLKDAKIHTDALTKSTHNLNAEFDNTDARLKAGIIDTLGALQEKFRAVQNHLADLFKNGGSQEAIQRDIQLLKQIQFQLHSLSSIDLNSSKGFLFGGNAEKEFHNYLQGAENVKKRTKELADGFYDTLGIQNPRDAIKRRQLDTELSDKGIDTSKYLDPNKNAKEQAVDLKNAGKGLNKEFNKTYSQLNKIVGGPLDDFTQAIFHGDNAMDALGNSIKNIVSSLAAAVIKAGIFSAIMSAINPTSFASGGGFLGILGKLLPFATGGIVTGPTPALVGEAGPEAIIPLNKLNSIMGNRNIDVSVHGEIRNRAIKIANDKATAIRTR